MKIPHRLTAITIALALATSANAASHREGPFIAENPKVDATDFYAFRSYEPGRDGYVTLIANYNPLQDAYGGPNYFSLSQDGLYEIHVDNNGDAKEDLTFQFDITNYLGNNGKGIALDIDGKKIPVPLKNIGQISTADSSALNFRESFEVNIVKGDRRSGTKHPVMNSVTGAKDFAKPFDNIGDKTFGTGEPYETYARAHIHHVTLDVCPAGANDAKIFIGQRKDPFAISLGKVFDLVNINPLGDVNGESDDLDDKNVTTIAMEVPIACLTGGNENGIIGAWTTASLPQVTVLDPTPENLEAQVTGGAWTQVSRLGMPLVNEVVIGLPDKNRFNASEPMDDGQFIDYVTSPSLPVLLNVLFGVTPPSAAGRPDLVAAFLTGLEGVNANGSAAEMIRLNTGIPATEKAAQHNLGVAAGDAAGFPNGRRPGDDVVDAALRVSMGLLCHLDLGLCGPDDATSGTLPYTDGVVQNAAQFGNAFPYLKAPLSGSSN